MQVDFLNLLLIIVQVLLGFWFVSFFVELYDIIAAHRALKHQTLIKVSHQTLFSAPLPELIEQQIDTLRDRRLTTNRRAHLVVQGLILPFEVAQPSHVVLCQRQGFASSATASAERGGEESNELPVPTALDGTSGTALHEGNLARESSVTGIAVSDASTLLETQAVAAEHENSCSEVAVTDVTHVEVCVSIPHDDCEARGAPQPATVPKKALAARSRVGGIEGDNGPCSKVTVHWKLRATAISGLMNSAGGDCSSALAMEPGRNSSVASSRGDLRTRSTNRTTGASSTRTEVFHEPESPTVNSHFSGFSSHPVLAPQLPKGPRSPTRSERRRMRRWMRRQKEQLKKRHRREKARQRRLRLLRRIQGRNAIAAEVDAYVSGSLRVACCVYVDVPRVALPDLALRCFIAQSEEQQESTVNASATGQGGGAGTGKASQWSSPSACATSTMGNDSPLQVVSSVSDSEFHAARVDVGHLPGPLPTASSRGAITSLWASLMALRWSWTRARAPSDSSAANLSVAEGSAGSSIHSAVTSFALGSPLVEGGGLPRGDEIGSTHRGSSGVPAYSVGAETRGMDRELLVPRSKMLPSAAQQSGEAMRLAVPRTRGGRLTETLSGPLPHDCTHRRESWDSNGGSSFVTGAEVTSLDERKAPTAGGGFGGTTVKINGDWECADQAPARTALEAAREESDMWNDSILEASDHSLPRRGNSSEFLTALSLLSSQPCSGESSSDGSSSDSASCCMGVETAKPSGGPVVTWLVPACQHTPGVTRDPLLLRVLPVTVLEIFKRAENIPVSVTVSPATVRHLIQARRGSLMKAELGPSHVRLPFEAGGNAQLVSSFKGMGNAATNESVFPREKESGEGWGQPLRGTQTFQPPSLDGLRGGQLDSIRQESFCETEVGFSATLNDPLESTLTSSLVRADPPSMGIMDTRDVHRLMELTQTQRQHHWRKTNEASLSVPMPSARGRTWPGSSSSNSSRSSSGGSGRGSSVCGQAPDDASEEDNIPLVFTVVVFSDFHASVFGTSDDAPLDTCSNFRCTRDAPGQQSAPTLSVPPVDPFGRVGGVGGGGASPDPATEYIDAYSPSRRISHGFEAANRSSRVAPTPPPLSPMLLCGQEDSAPLSRQQSYAAEPSGAAGGPTAEGAGEAGGDGTSLMKAIHPVESGSLFYDPSDELNACISFVLARRKALRQSLKGGGRGALRGATSQLSLGLPKRLNMFPHLWGLKFLGSEGPALGSDTSSGGTTSPSFTASLIESTSSFSFTSCDSAADSPLASEPRRQSWRDRVDQVRRGQTGGEGTAGNSPTRGQKRMLYNAFTGRPMRLRSSQSTGTEHRHLVGTADWQGSNYDRCAVKDHLSTAAGNTSTSSLLLRVHGRPKPPPPSPCSTPISNAISTFGGKGGRDVAGLQERQAPGILQHPTNPTPPSRWTGDKCADPFAGAGPLCAPLSNTRDGVGAATTPAAPLRALLSSKEARVVAARLPIVLLYAAQHLISHDSIAHCVGSQRMQALLPNARTAYHCNKVNSFYFRDRLAQQGSHADSQVPVRGEPSHGAGVSCPGSSAPKEAVQSSPMSGTEVDVSCPLKDDRRAVIAPLKLQYMTISGQLFRIQEVLDATVAATLAQSTTDRTARRHWSRESESDVGDAMRLHERRSSSKNSATEFSDVLSYSARHHKKGRGSSQSRKRSRGSHSGRPHTMAEYTPSDENESSTSNRTRGPLSASRDSKGVKKVSFSDVTFVQRHSASDPAAEDPLYQRSRYSGLSMKLGTHKSAAETPATDGDCLSKRITAGAEFPVDASDAGNDGERCDALSSSRRQRRVGHRKRVMQELCRADRQLLASLVHSTGGTASHVHPHSFHAAHPHAEGRAHGHFSSTGSLRREIPQMCDSGSASAPPPYLGSSYDEAATREAAACRRQSDEGGIAEPQRKYQRKRSPHQCQKRIECDTSHRLDLYCPSLPGGPGQFPLQPLRTGRGAMIDGDEDSVPVDSLRKGATYRTDEAPVGARGLCLICCRNEARVIFLPCGHYATCKPCTRKLRACPVCRDVIVYSVILFGEY